jgi:glyoxylase-like metal-dependent hydrolase (beta-lactamase superfamily II)
MSRWPFSLALLPFALVSLPGLAPGQDFSDVEFTVTPVAGPIHVLDSGVGGNIGVSVGADGVLLVDDQFAPLAGKIRKAVEGLGGGELRFILNTHYHGDHTGANPEFGPEATIIGHENLRKRLMTDQVLSRGTFEALPSEGWPVITFEEGLSVHFNGEEIRVVHFPHAHTDGDAVVHFTGSNVVHLGDILFAGKFPFVDLEGGGSVDGYIRALETVVETMPADADYIAGHHGPVVGLDAVKESVAMIRETRDIVAKHVGEGMDLEAVKAAGLPEKYASYDWAFITTDRWLETLYRSVAGE